MAQQGRVYGTNQLGVCPGVDYVELATYPNGLSVLGAPPVAESVEGDSGSDE